MVTVLQDGSQKVQSNKQNNTFLALQKVMEMGIIRKGKNSYNLTHIKKSNIQREGILPEQLMNAIRS